MSGARDVADAVEELGFELLIEASELIESIAISTREAAYRRDLTEVRLRLAHMRLAVIEMSKTFAEMSGAQGPPP